MPIKPPSILNGIDYEKVNESIQNEYSTKELRGIPLTQHEKSCLKEENKKLEWSSNASNNRSGNALMFFLILIGLAYAGLNPFLALSISALILIF